ncbi:MAG TPA: type V CRISPR-associated protein Cas12a/Cpf1 [Petrimonas sp.]|jgi:CRISPR-associated protein Cpf1|nr:type V CRISPR-associated protein Cas12a/Cpf1 [Petrimonas sp.]
MTIKKHKPFTNFECLTPVQKTLRFRLIPVGRTTEFVKCRNIIEADRKRSEMYPLLKELADRFYREFMTDQLSNLLFDWSPLVEALLLARNNTDPRENQRIASLVRDEQKKYRTLLLKRLSGQVDRNGTPLPKNTASVNKKYYDDLFKARFVTETLPAYLEHLKNKPDGRISDELFDAYKDALDSYQKFTSRLTNFWQARKNIFTDEDIATGFAYRIVHEIVPDFLFNRWVYEQHKLDFPEPLDLLETELKKKNLIANDESLDALFTIPAINRLLTQKGVDLHNAVIGGFFTDDHTKVQGFNELANLKNQTLKNVSDNSEIKPVGKMTRLKKHILSISESTSFLFEQIESDEDLLARIIEFNNTLSEPDIDGLSIADINDQLYNIMTGVDPSTILVHAKNLNELSHEASLSWNRLRDGLYQMATESPYREDERFKRYIDASEDERDLSKLKNDIYFSLQELQFALDQSIDLEEEATPTEDIFLPFEFPGMDLKSELTVLFRSIEQLISSETKLIGNPDAIATIKKYLDAIMARYSIWNLLSCEAVELQDDLFYPEYDRVMGSLSNIILLYNLARNYLSRKPSSKEKFRLNFDKPTLADGWSESKVPDNFSVLLRKDDLFYLGILKDRKAYRVLSYENCDETAKNIKGYYERMIYHFSPDAYRMIPKCSTARKDVKKHFGEQGETTGYTLYPGASNFVKPFTIPYEIYRLQTELVNDKKRYQADYLKQTEDEEGYRQAVTAWIDFCKSYLESYEGTSTFDYSHLLKSEDYEDVNQFYADVDRASYSIYFEKVSVDLIHTMVDRGDLYLFQLYNKDFSPHSTGKPNLHTMYWRALFSNDNLQNNTIKLNGQAELFYRPKQVEQPTVHLQGSFLLNRFDKYGDVIPAGLYCEIYNHINERHPEGYTLSEEATQGLLDGRFVYREAPFELVKDKRYTEDQFFLHVPLEFNWTASANVPFENLANEYIKKDSDLHIIGIDRGERNLLYYSVINLQGDIVKQGSLNTLIQQTTLKGETVERQIPYQSMLKQREDERAEARQNWQSIDRIKDLKEGYLSHVIYKLSRLIIKYHAIVVMENLNVGFKRGRFKVERQVYQKFEVALINKLNALSFKEYEPNELGGVMRPWQLARRVVSPEDTRSQNGIVFYVPASYTSIVDPVTGFANLFYLNRIRNKDLNSFYGHFQEIRYDHEFDRFIFRFNYADFGVFCRIKNVPSRTWNLVSGERKAFNPKRRMIEKRDTTDEIKKALEAHGIAYQNEQNLLPLLLENENLLARIHRSFRLVLQLRNSDSDRDDIVSPALDKENNTFDSGQQPYESSLPINADANGAYNIARKGLLLVDKVKNDKRAVLSNREWFEYLMAEE